MLKKTERIFEKVSESANKVMGNSITFILAILLVIYWLSQERFLEQDIHDSTRDVLLSITFLYSIMNQKSYNRLSAATNLKLNELIASHDAASNDLIKVDKKSEQEISALSKDHTDLHSPG
jgi:low affinity Fe/Cu permease